MIIKIPNYEILNFDKNSLIISESGISKIHSQPLLNALKKMKTHSALTEEDVAEIFAENGLTPNSTFEFLEKALGLKRYENEAYFEKTVIISDWSGKVELERLLTLELSLPLEFRDFSEDFLTSVAGKKYFIVLLCKGYNYQSLKKMYFELAITAPDSAISVCHQIGNVFCIGQPYVRSIGNPCHFCDIDRMANNEKVHPAKGSWAGLLNFCRNNHVEVPTKPLTLYQELIVIAAISRKVKFFTEAGHAKQYQDNILYASYLNLVDGTVAEESSAHWCMCDCLSIE